MVIDKVLFVLAKHIEWIQKSENGIHCGLVFEYDKNISVDSVVSVITFKLQDSTLFVGVFNEKTKKETIILEAKNSQNAKETAALLFKSLCKLNKKVAMGKLFLMDKVIMYHNCLGLGEPITTLSQHLEIEKEIAKEINDELLLKKT